MIIIIIIIKLGLFYSGFTFWFTADQQFLWDALQKRKKRKLSLGVRQHATVQTIFEETITRHDQKNNFRSPPTSFTLNISSFPPVDVSEFWGAGSAVLKTHLSTCQSKPRMATKPKLVPVITPAGLLFLILNGSMWMNVFVYVWVYPHEYCNNKVHLNLSTLQQFKKPTRKKSILDILLDYEKNRQNKLYI